MKLKLCLLTIFSFALVGCTQNTQTNRAYQELGRSQHFQLVSDGYIVGLEKINIKHLKGLTAVDGYTQRFQQIEGSGKYVDKLNSEFKSKTTNQSKVMLATQITRNFPTMNFMYNAYSGSLDGKYDYEKSFFELDRMFDDLSHRLKTGNYTHIVIMSMGWNNDQVESVFRYNEIIKNISKAANDEKAFKPLVIGFTWPSVWMSISDSWLTQKAGHLLSYPTKANDADEIGYTWANLVINEKLPQAIKNAQSNGLKKGNTPKVVVLGHSFGARLLSRALFSKRHLKSSNSESVVDMFFGLQGAFSINRFVPDTGLEGSPYKGYEKLGTSIILTSSTEDTANPIAAWITGAKHAGGKHGLSVAKDEENVACFDNHKWKKDTVSVPLHGSKLMMIDASEIVINNKDGDDPNYTYSGHNDVLDLDMGKLLWSFIRQIP